MAINMNNAVFWVAAAAGAWVFCALLRVASRYFGLRSSEPEPAKSEGRSLSRFNSQYRASLQLLDTGGQMKNARLIDLSEYGARVSCESELRVGTPVRLWIPEIASAATGRVRNCTKKWIRYRIGLEFQGTLYKTSF